MLLRRDAVGVCNSHALNYSFMTHKIRNHEKSLELQYCWVKGDASLVTLYHELHKQWETALTILCHLIFHWILLRGNIWKAIFQRSSFWHSKYIFGGKHQKYFILCLRILTCVSCLCESEETMENFSVNFRISVLPWDAPLHQKLYAGDIKQFWESKL